MRSVFTSFALVRQCASVVELGNRFAVFSKIMELPHIHDGKKHVPIPTGRYVVGCTDLMVGPDIESGCFLRVYFPSQIKDVHEHSSRWARWLPHYKYIEGYTLVLGFIPFFGKKLISWAFGNAYIPVVMDAEPSNDQKFPVVVFSHGLTACRTAYSTFCSEISSHGFVVAAIEHRDGSACMSYTLEKEDNKEDLVEKWIPYKPMQFEKEDMPLRQEQLLHRIRECQLTLDFLLKLNEGADVEHLLHSTMDLGKFKGLMDLSTPMIAGHSFGSATLLRTLAVDKRFKAGLAMDAWMWPLKDQPELAQEIEQPLLFINMEAFQTEPNLKTMKRFTSDADHITERRVVTLKGSVHKNQVDLPFLLPLYLRRLTGSHSTIDPLLAMELNNRITLLYLRKHLGHPADVEHSKLVEKHADWFYEGIP